MDFKIDGKSKNEFEDEFRTVDKLIGMMAKITPPESKDKPSDVVLLYQNLDLESNLQNTNCRQKKSNQLMETVVHGGDDELPYDFDSYLINNDRLDLINNKFDYPLCHKCGCTIININRRTNLAAEYNKYLKFNDLFEESNNLIDYVCHKRLENDFDLDNVIVYLKNTIKQLKRISNGDYLSEKAKEIWQANNTIEDKLLTAVASIPLNIERKVTKDATKWNDLVHSDVDIRSLCKILKKKIVFDIPKFINSSYDIFSHSGDDGMILRCQRKDIQSKDEEGPHVDVIFQIKQSDFDHFISNISSKMILQNSTPQSLQVTDSIPAIQYKKEINIIQDSINIAEINANISTEIPHEEPQENNSKAIITEIHDNTIPLEITNKQDDVIVSNEIQKNKLDDKLIAKKSVEDINENESDNQNKRVDDKLYDNKQLDDEEFPEQSSLPMQDEFESGQNSLLHDQDNFCTVCIDESTNSTLDMSHYLNTNSNQSSEENVKPKIIKTDSNYDLDINLTTGNSTPDELMVTIQKLSKQSSVLEEIEELTIKESVKSIRNRSPSKIRIKSPYANNSHAIEEKKRNRLLEIREKREKKKLALSENCKMKKNKFGIEGIQPQASTSVTKLSITNKSFYNSIFGGKTNVLKKGKRSEHNKKGVKKEISKEDFQFKVEDSLIPKVSFENVIKDLNSFNISETSSFSETNNFTIIDNDIEKHTEAIAPIHNQILRSNTFTTETEDPKPNLASSEENAVPENTPRKLENHSKKDLSKNSSWVVKDEIHKIYNLIKNLHPKGEIHTEKPSQSSFVPESDSGTSFKHMSSSNPSSYSFDKSDLEFDKKTYKKYSPTVPKVIISTKLQTLRQEITDKAKLQERTPNKSTSLKVISQMLNEFDSVKAKTKEELKVDQKYNRKPIKSQDVNTSRLQSTNKINKIDFRESRNRPSSFLLTSKFDHINVEHVHNANNNLSDIINEARGEAVKGSSITTSRIHALAQPKRSYVQAHSQEFQNKYGRNIMPDRLGTSKPGNIESLSFGRKSKVKNNNKKDVDYDMDSPIPIKVLEKTLRTMNRNSMIANLEKSPTRHDNGTPEYRKMKKFNKLPNDITTYKSDITSPTNKPFCVIKKSRVPLVPTNLDLGSNLSSSLNNKEYVGVEQNIIKKNLPKLPEYLESDEDFDEFNKYDNADKFNKNDGKVVDNITNKNDEVFNLKQIIAPNKIRLKTNDILQKHVSFYADANPIPVLSLSSTKIDFQTSKIDWPTQITSVSYSFPKLEIVRPHSAPNKKKNDVTNEIHKNKHKATKDQALQTNCLDNVLKTIYSNEFCQTEVANECKSNDIDGQQTINVATSNSLDILVDLLNEIQNITTRQTQIANANDEEAIFELNYQIGELKTSKTLDEDCKINVAKNNIDPKVCVSKMREIYESKVNVSSSIAPILFIDKEISTNVDTKNTNVASQVFIFTGTNGTNTNCTIDQNKMNTYKIISDDNNNMKYDTQFVFAIKRDILVTVYSVLVLTVVAALSLPDFIHQNIS